MNGTKNKQALVHRNGKECNKTGCVRHESYLQWRCGDSNLNFCMECKHSHVSQYKRKQIEVVK